ncbi:MAG: hypothetical protein QXX32_07395 [Thermofilum sp.]
MSPLYNPAAVYKELGDTRINRVFPKHFVGVFLLVDGGRRFGTHHGDWCPIFPREQYLLPIAITPQYVHRQDDG